MTVERMKEIMNVIKPYDTVSHTWEEIKDFMTMTLPVEESTEIIYDIERYDRFSGRFKPHNNRYYTVHFFEGSDKYDSHISLLRDYVKSPRDKVYDHLKEDTYPKISEYIKSSHNWSIIKDYLRKTLTEEQANYIISHIELNRDGKPHDYSPSEKEGVYYFLFWNNKRNRYSVRLDEELSITKP